MAHGRPIVETQTLFQDIQPTADNFFVEIPILQAPGGHRLNTVLCILQIG